MKEEKAAQRLKRELIAKAHHLQPVVRLGSKGLTNNVLAEIDRALTDHQLIKVKVCGDSASEKQEVSESIATSLAAELLRLIGNNAILYRPLIDDYLD